MIIKRYFLYAFPSLLFVSLSSSWGEYDYLFFVSVIVLVLSYSQLYLMVVMDRFYVGMGVELEKGWGDIEIKLQKIGLILLYSFVAIISAFFGFIRES